MLLCGGRASSWPCHHAIGVSWVSIHRTSCDHGSVSPLPLCAMDINIPISQEHCETYCLKKGDLEECNRKLKSGLKSHVIIY